MTSNGWSKICDFARKLTKTRKILTEKMPKNALFLVFFGVFCVCICKCLIFKEKKFNIFAKIILKSVAQFKKILYLYNVKEKQILTIKNETIMKKYYVNGKQITEQEANAIDRKNQEYVKSNDLLLWAKIEWIIIVNE